MILKARARYEERFENEQEEFKKVLTSYLIMYALLSQILPYPDIDLEKLSAYGRVLANAIRSKKPGIVYRLMTMWPSYITGYRRYARIHKWN